MQIIDRDEGKGECGFHLTAEQRCCSPKTFNVTCSWKQVEKGDRLIYISSTRTIRTSAFQKLRAKIDVERIMARFLNLHQRGDIFPDSHRTRELLQIFFLLLDPFVFVSAVLVSFDIFVDAFLVRDVRKATAINTIAAVIKVDAVNAVRTVFYASTSSTFARESVGHKK